MSYIQLSNCSYYNLGQKVFHGIATLLADHMTILKNVHLIFFSNYGVISVTIVASSRILQ